MQDLNNSGSIAKEVINGLVPAQTKYSLIGLIPGALLHIPTATKFLLIFMAIDVLTGLIAGWSKGELSSSVGRKGLSLKVLILTLVYTASYVTKALGSGVDLGSGVAIVYTVNEVISIIENCARAGVPIPSILVQSLIKVKATARVATTAELSELNRVNCEPEKPADKSQDSK